MRSVNTMVQQWREQALVLLPPETESAVRDSFAKVGSVATSDVISMYAVLGGMEQDDRECWRLWSLSELVSENSDRSSYGVLFADYLISCWCYRLVPNANDTSAVFVDYFDVKKPVQVATCLDEFFLAYAVYPSRLLEGA